jgi:hypothetical protein
MILPGWVKSWETLEEFLSEESCPLAQIGLYSLTISEVVERLNLAVSKERWRTAAAWQEILLKISKEVSKWKYASCCFSGTTILTKEQLEEALQLFTSEED